jgi:Protein of unknown function (DUF2934)
MIAPKAHTQATPKTVVRPGSTGKVAMMPDSTSAQNMIRERAYELYESRGREPGQEEQDWFRAERELKPAR